MSDTNSFTKQRAAYVAGDSRQSTGHAPQAVTVMVLGEALVITLGAALTRHVQTVEGGLRVRKF
jgi:hypothetical protein